MSREVKRVPLDFAWPLVETWSGYVAPHWRDCPNPDCRNGSTIAGRWVEAIVYQLLMLDDDVRRRGRPLHPWLEAVALRPAERPTTDITAWATAMAGRPSSSLGHDGLDQWAVLRKVVGAAGLGEDYFICKICKGTAIHPDDLAASEAWERTDPPTGDGWQLWETVSEGSPITPVFVTAEDLIDHLVNVKGFRRSAATVLVMQGYTVGTMVGDGVTLMRSDKDADLIADATAD